MLAAVFACALMAFVDGVLMPGYAVKSAIKIAAFFALPILVAATEKSVDIKHFFKFGKKGFKTALLLGIVIYAVIVGGYFLLSGIIDFSGIAGSLSKNAGVTRENFLYVSLYISFINSFLEEFLEFSTELVKSINVAMKQ